MKRNILFLLLLGLSTIAAPLVAADKSVMSLKQLVETRHVSSVAVSPDGKFSAYTLTVPRTAYEEKDGKHFEELHIVEPNGQSRKFVTGKVAVYNVQWESSSKFIYYQAKRNDDKFTSIYRIAIDGGESEKVVTAKNNIIDFSINFDSSSLVYIAKPAAPKNKKKLKEKGFKAKIYEESVKKSSAYLVDLKAPNKEHKKLSIKDHIRSIAFSPVDNQLLMRVTPTALIDDDYVASQFRIYSRKGKQLKAFKTEGKLTIGRWSKDGKNVAMIGAENKNDPAAGRLYVGNVRTQKVTEPVKNYMGHIKDIEWLSDYQLAYLGHVGTKSEVGIINIDNTSVTQKISEGHFVLKELSTDNSGKVINAIASTSDIPREVVDVSSGKVKRLTDSNAWLSEIKMPKQETIIHKARDGVELQGVFIYPTNYKKGKRYPMIMMVHGGPESHVSDEWLDKYSYPIKHASANGFAVFLPNYRG
ncbi:MAG: S9 family peptidase, partial [Kangiellaceae bacterium]|nr:S9 family peptidase [Kangiellaceae bacterium]